MPQPYQQIVNVGLPNREYAIGIGDKLLENVDALMEVDGPYVVFSDRTVSELYGSRVCEALAKRSEVHRFIVNDGEPSKSIDVANQLWQDLVLAGVDRRAAVVALGGGVVGDLAGFIAATYLRGLDFIQIPTSLLAQVDSSVGGKVGVNLPQGKNLVGAFLQPKQVIIDSDVLNTLDERQFRAGMAEVIKYAVILSEPFFQWLQDNVSAITDRQANVLQEMIAKCCQFKAEVVVEDERETTGRRAILNYGHTLGHAIEAVCGYGEYVHGEAIAIGMHFAMRLAHHQGMIGHDEIDRQRHLIEAFGLPVAVPGVETDELIRAMYHDKKTTDAQLNFILPDRIGSVKLVKDIPASQIEDLLKSE